jgi:8-oxo-dGTP diphosphatase
MKLGMYNIVVKAIIFNKNKVLLLKRSNYQKEYANKWDIPGGRLEPGEDPNKAIHREIFEETGIKVVVEKPFEIYKWYSKSEKVDKVMIGYICRYKSGKLKLSKEHNHIEWYDINKLPKEVTKWVKESSLKAKKLR